MEETEEREDLRETEELNEEEIQELNQIIDEDEEEDEEVEDSEEIEDKEDEINNEEIDDESEEEMKQKKRKRPQNRRSFRNNDDDFDNELLPRALPLFLDNEKQYEHQLKKKNKGMKGGGGGRGRGEANTKVISENKPPDTGAEYLQQVRMQASKLPDVVVAPLNHFAALDGPSGSKKSKLLNLFDSDPKNTEREELLKPKGEWINDFLMQFAAWRISLERLSKKGTKPLNVPKINDERGWKLYCLGNLPSNHINLEQLNDSALTENSGDRKPPTPPSLSVIGWMNQKQTLNLIYWVANWILNDVITDSLAQWIFALFLRIDKLLTSDACDALRGLCRKCLLIRKQLSLKIGACFTDEKNNSQNNEIRIDPIDEHTLIYANIFITVVVKYFQQRDLD